VYPGAGKPLVLETLPDPEPGPEDLVIKVHRCGICGTDLHLTSGHRWDFPAGTVAGHEYSGEIVGIGSNVSGFKTGELITALPSTGCGHCEACYRGNLTLCHHAPGVMGAGTVALCAIYWARRLGAGRIAASSRSQRRAAMALDMGADVFVQYGGNEKGEVAEALGGPPNIVFECVGSPGFLTKGIQHAAPFGQVISLGFCTEPDPVLPAMAGMKGVSLQFPVGYSLKDFQYVADVMDAGHADPKMLISKVVALDDLPSTFERLRGPNSDTKVQVSPAGL
jgi:(R,R)-butanediol dehydrogenase/meso-butanediol dehydrogenase/diacetyl reductase